MGATLDNLLEAIERTNDLLEEIRDEASTGTGGGSRGQAGGRSEEGGAGGGGLSILKNFKKGFGHAAALSSAFDAAGVSQGLRASNLGATGSQALQTGARALAQTITDLPGGSFVAANIGETLSAQNRAQTSVSNIAEQVARAGGSLSREGIREALSRQNEIEGRVQKARQTVAFEQAGVGGRDLGEASLADAKNLAPAMGRLGIAINRLIEVMQARTASAGGVR